MTLAAFISIRRQGLLPVASRATSYRSRSTLFYYDLRMLNNHFVQLLIVGVLMQWASAGWRRGLKGGRWRRGR